MARRTAGKAPSAGSGARIERVAVAKLKHDERNARRHGSRNLEAVRESLRRFGQQRPIVVGDGGVVLAGNATLAAARELGWSHVDAIRTRLRGKEAAAYAVADNRTAELAEWDGAVLEALAKEVDLSAFFSDGELEAIVGSWQVTETELEKLDAQHDLSALTTWIRVSCAEADREAVLEAVRAAVSDFKGATVE